METIDWDHFELCEFLTKLERLLQFIVCDHCWIGKYQIVDVIKSVELGAYAAIPYSAVLKCTRCTHSIHIRGSIDAIERSTNLRAEDERRRQDGMMRTYATGG